MAELNRLPNLAIQGAGDPAKENNNLVFDDQEMIFASLSDAVNHGPRKTTTSEYLSNELLGWASFATKEVVPKVASTFCRSGQYAKTAFFGDALKEETAESSTYSITRGIEFGLVNLALPALALYADASVIGSTIITATVATCAVNAISLGVKSGTTYIAAEKAKEFNETVDFGLNFFNTNVVKTTKDLCFLEHKVIWGAQKIFGCGVTKIADNIQDPSDLIAVGKSVESVALNLWDSVKCGYEYVSTFMGSQSPNDLEAHEEEASL